ncbi:hypothetical protein ERJ75_001086900 [Trypanosoma vivax]|nr:hypothetical protein ERJ75_001086900 [Trypanosoma vivax]
MLRRIWDLILRIVRLRASVSFQFVFSHCGVPRNETEDKAAEQGNAKPQSRPAWVTGIVTGVERSAERDMQGPRGGSDATHASQRPTRPRSASTEAHHAGSSG